MPTMPHKVVITSWNVNSIRTRLDHVLTYLADHDPDILCLQETKVEDALFPRVPFMELGYTVTLHGDKQKAGVATMTKSAPTEVIRGFRAPPPDRHCRILNTVTDGLRVYNVYAPNGSGLGTDAFAYKLTWYRRLRSELDAHHKPDDPIVIVGDFNVAPDDRDVWDPDAFRGRLLFTDEEHAALQNLLAFGLLDCFRVHESAAGHFTWFDYRTAGVHRGEGMRIDHVYATAALAAANQGVEHDLGPRTWEVPSDHVPVTANFSLDR
jgi:exodeoxyribonuclease-3